jgi:hypothetical protein
MARRHPEPTGAIEVPVFRDVEPVLSVSGVADYFEVSKQLVARWAKRPDWPSPFARPPSGALYRTADVIEWAKANERKRGEGPRASHDPRPPSAQKARRRPRAA